MPSKTNCVKTPLCFPTDWLCACHLILQVRNINLHLVNVQNKNCKITFNISWSGLISRIGSHAAEKRASCSWGWGKSQQWRICFAWRRLQVQSLAFLGRAGWDPCLILWRASASQWRDSFVLEGLGISHLLLLCQHWTLLSPLSYSLTHSWMYTSSFHWLRNT